MRCALLKKGAKRSKDIFFFGNICITNQDSRQALRFCEIPMFSRNTIKARNKSPLELFNFVICKQQYCFENVARSLIVVIRTMDSLQNIKRTIFIDIFEYRIDYKSME